MRRCRGLSRLGLLAVGLGIGAALASSPGAASADPSTDPFSWIGGMDLGDLSVPAQTSALDMQVSIFGLDLFPTVGNTATAFSDLGDIAIAIGNGANATASPLGDIAIAIGNNSFATAGGGLFDFAFADGTNINAEAGTGIFDAAFVDGTNSQAFAGGTALEFPQPPILGSFDLAAAFGDMLHAFASGNFMTDILP